MGSGMRMSSPPPGEPRFVAAFYQPASGWKVAAESTAREPVDYAVSAMIRTVRSRGETPTVEVWGPSEDGRGWQRLDTVSGRRGSAPAQSAAVAERPAGSAREERLRDRRHQVLLAALASAGLTDLGPADTSAIVDIVDGVSEDAVRRIAFWLSAACDRS